MNTSACTDLKVLDLVPFGQTGGEARFFALRLERPQWADWKPGQFVMLRPAGWALDMLWARPFSICRISARDLVIFFQVVGRGTARLAQLRTGDVVHVWGPLGNAFAMEPDTPTLMLAGGIGIAPFIGYAHTHPKPWNLWMDFGHRMPLGCYPFESINEKIMADSHHEEGPEDLSRFIETMGRRGRVPGLRVPHHRAMARPGQGGRQRADLHPGPGVLGRADHLRRRNRRPAHGCRCARAGLRTLTKILIWNPPLESGT